MGSKASITESKTGRRSPIDPPQFNIISFILLVACIAPGAIVALVWKQPLGAVVGMVVGFIAAASPQVAQQWERAVVLRLGNYTGLRGPGLFWIIPGIDRVSSWIDQRIITTSFAAEETLTSDTVPVNVDAVLFWMVYDPEKAALEVQDYRLAVTWAAQTALARHHRPHAADRAAPRPRADRGAAPEADRRAVQSLGCVRPVGRDARRGHPRIVAGRDVARGAGRPREGGADHPRPGRGRDRPPVRPGRRVVPAQPDRAAPAGHEHPVRGHQGEGCLDAGAQHGRRVDGPRRHARHGRPAPAGHQHAGRRIGRVGPGANGPVV